MLEQVHMPTLFVATSIVQGMAAIMITGLVRMYGSEPAVRWWALAFFLHAIAAGIYSLSSGNLSFSVIFLGNACSIGGAICVYTGVACYLKKQVYPRFFILLFLGSLSLICYFAIVTDQLAIRNMIYTTVACIAYGLTARILLGVPRESRRLVHTSLGLSYLFLCITFTWRAIDLFHPATDDELMKSSAAQVLWMISIQFTTFLSLTGFLLLISERMHDELQDLAQFDPLTGTSTRSYFFKRAEALSQESPEKRWAFCVVDMDHFKYINDTYGHDQGDIALKEVASMLTCVTPKHSIICRAGGDEFWILCPIDQEPCQHILEALNNNMKNQSIRSENATITLTLSVGTCEFAAQDFSHFQKQIMTLADEALYTAKCDGRDTYSITRLEKTLFA